MWSFDLITSGTIKPEYHIHAWNKDKDIMLCSVKIETCGLPVAGGGYVIWKCFWGKLMLITVNYFEETRKQVSYLIEFVVTKVQIVGRSWSQNDYWGI